MTVAKTVMHDALPSYANPEEEIILIPRFYAFFTSHFLCTLKIQKESQPETFFLDESKNSQIFME